MKSMVALAVLTALAVAAVIPDSAQAARLLAEPKRCGIPAPPKSVRKRVKKRLAAAPMGVSAAVSGGTINVYCHVIDNGSGLANGDVPETMIDARIEVLKQAFMPHGWTFDLAGVTRTTHRSWYRMEYGSRSENQAKAALHEGDPRTLNTHSCNPNGGPLGWATFPWSFTTRPTADGVVLVFSALPGGSAAPCNEGDTATHVVGHWLGLYHTFRGERSGKGDYVGDTPPEKSPGLGCAAGRDTCDRSGMDPIGNFTDFSDDWRRFEFTAGQAERMGRAWVVLRNPR